MQAQDGAPDAESPAPTPSPRPSADPLPDRATSKSTNHPDPCGVDSKNGLDYIDKEDHFSEGPADRVQAVARDLFGDRFLGVYIANVKQQYGIGVGVHRLTHQDEDAFFDETCFRVGDVVFENGPVSGVQLREWRAAATEILFAKDAGGCSLSHEWRTGRVEVGMKEGHADTERKLAEAIPAENLHIEHGGCPVAM